VCNRGSPSAAYRTARAWARSAASSSALSPGSTACAACAPATNAAPTSTKPSSTSAYVGAPTAEGLLPGRRGRFPLGAAGRDARVADIASTARVHRRLAERDLAPTQHLVDAAYVAADQILAARQEHGTDLVGPHNQGAVASLAVTIRSFVRPVTVRWPSWPSSPRSPVRSQPWSKARGGLLGVPMAEDRIERRAAGDRELEPAAEGPAS
jgi:hypothetical protein